MQDNNFVIRLQAFLDKVKSIANIKTDIKNIESKLSKIKIQGTLDSVKTKKELNTKIKSINPKVIIYADVTKAERKIKKIGQQKTNTVIQPTVDNSQVMSSLKATQKETKSLFDHFLSETVRINLVRMSVQKVTQAIYQAITGIKELDKIKTNIQMVSGSSDSGVDSMMKSYNLMAKELSSTTKSVSEAANEFLRMGESVSNTNELIKSSQVLSKVGMIESSEAASYLISSLKGYKIAAEDSMDIVSKLTSVDLEAAVSAGGLAEALSKCSNIANNSGISMDRLVGYTATVGEVTQKSMSEVGNSFQSLLSRMNNIKINKFIDDETGESLSDTEAVLNKLGIQLRDTEDTYRKFDDVLDDIGSGWENFTKVEQNAISVAIAGTRQRENFEALMNNWGDALKYSETAANSAGSALERYGTYQDSIEAKTNELTAAIEELSTSTISENMFSGIIEATTNIVEFIDKTNLLKGTLAGLVTLGISKAFVSMASGIVTAYKSTAQLTNAMALFNKGTSESNIEKIGKACIGLSDRQLKLVLSTKGLTYEQRKQILLNKGVAESEVETTLATLGFTNAENAATVSTFSFSGALNTLKTAIASNPIGIIVTTVSIATMVFSTFNDSVEKATDKTKELADEVVKEEENIESLIAQYNKLDKTDRSTENTETIKNLNEDINKALGSQADNLDLVNGKLDEQSDKLKRNLLLKLQDDQGDIDANVAATSTEYEKGLDQGTWGIDSWGNVTRALKENGATLLGKYMINNVGNDLEKLDADQQLAQLKEWRDLLTEKYKETGNYGDEVNLLNKWYNELDKKREERDKALQNQQLRDEKERILSDWDAGNIGDLEAFKAYREEIQETYKENSVLQNQMLDFIDNLFPEFAKKLQETKQTTSSEASQPKTFKEAWKSIGQTGDKEADKKALEAKEKLLELAEAGKLTEEALEKSSIASVFTDAKISIEEATEEINKMKSSADQLASMKTGISSISSILGEKKENQSSKKTRTKGIGADTLAGMPEDVKAQTKEYEHFVEVLGDGTSKMEDCKDAANKLATAYVTSNNFLANLTEGKEDYYKSVLKEMGVENAAEVVTAALNRQKINAKIATFDLKNATEQEISTLGAYIKSLDDSSKSLAYYTLQQQIANNNALDTSDSIKNLKQLAKQCGITGEAISIMTSLAKDMKKVEYYTTGKGKNDRDAGSIVSSANYEVNGNKKRLNQIIKKGVKVGTSPKINPQNSSGSKSGSKKDKSSKSKSTQVIDWIERRLKNLQNTIDFTAAKLQNLFNFNNRNTKIDKQIKNTTKLINAYGLAAAKYREKAKQVAKPTTKTKKDKNGKKKKVTVKGLSKDVIQMVKTGKLTKKTKLSTLIKEYGEDQAEKIQSYIDYTDKARDARKNQQDQIAKKREYKQEKYQNYVDRAEGNISLYEQQKENSSKAADKNDYLDKEVEWYKESYAYQIKIAGLSKDETEQKRLQAELEAKLRDLQMEHHQNLADEYQSNLDMMSAQKENLTTASEKNALIESEKATTQALYAEKIAIAQLEGNTAEALQLQAELTKALLDLEIERHQNLADEYQMTLDRYSAAKALETTAAGKNALIDSEKTTTEALYKEKIDIANLEGKTDEALQLQYEKEKAIRDLEVERHQNLADEHQSNLDMLSAQKENLKTSSEKNAVVDKEKNLTVQLYNEKIAIAQLEGNISEELRLQAELDKKLIEFEKEKLDNIVQYYKNIRKINENISKNLSNSLDELEARGLIATRSIYMAQGKLNDGKKRNLEEELILLERQHDNIEKGTQEWYDSLDSIQDCKDEIAGCVTTAIELSEAIRNIDWKIFDKVSSRFDLLSSEYDLGIELMSDKQLTDKDTGNFTTEGSATLGAYYSQLLLAQEKTSEFKDTLDEMKKRIDKGDEGYTDQKVLDEYNERYEEYIELIKSEYGIRQKLVDLMKQKYQAELDYLQDIINKRKELLQAEKDAYDYQRNIEEKTKNVTVIAKQIAALNGDDSEGAKTRIQQLQVSLDEANKDLQDAEYNQWLNDQQTMLDNLYNEYSDFIEKKLNDTDALIQEAVTYLQDDEIGKSVGKCLNDYYTKYRYDTTNDFKDITNELGENGSIVKAIGNAVNSIIEYSETQQRYQAKADDVSSAVSEIGNVFEDKDAITRYVQAQNKYDKLATAGDNGENIQQYVDSSTVSTLNSTGKEVEQIRTGVNKFIGAVGAIGKLDDRSSYTEANGKLLADAYDLYNNLSTSGKQLVGSYKNTLDFKQEQYNNHGSAIQREQEEKEQRAAEQAAAEEQRKADARSTFILKLQQTYLADGRTYADMSDERIQNVKLDDILKNYGLFRSDGYPISEAGASAIMNQLGYSRPENRTRDYMYQYMKNIGFSQGGIVETLQKIPGMNGDDGWATLKRGEAVLTPEQTEQFIKLVRNLDTLNPAIEAMKSISKTNFDVVPNQMVSQSVGDINIDMSFPNVMNYEQFRKQMQSDPKIEKMFKSMIWDKGSLSKYKITM